MTHQEDYRFDVIGYLIVPSVLSKEEIEALDASSITELADHPVLRQYVADLSFGDATVDEQPHFLEEVDAPLQLEGGNEPRLWSRAYQHRNGTRYCHGVRAVLALSDVNEGDGGIVLVPGSHRSDLETPSDLRDGTDDMGLVEQPVLRAGDILLCAETVLHGMLPWKGNGPQRLLTCTFISDIVKPSVDLKRETPGWIDEMTPEQRVVLNIGEDSHNAIRSDGQNTWVESTNVAVHPSIHTRDPESGIDQKEFYFWDLCGYLLVKGVMDEPWMAAAHEAIDAHIDRLELNKDGSRGSPRLAGDRFSSMYGIMELPHPHCEPFRAMIAHPAVVHRLAWMMGSGFFLDRARAIHYEKGTGGLYVHSTPEPASPRNTYALQNGRTYSEQINVTWQLVETKAGDGGYVCVPGSNKANYPIPERLSTCEEELGMVKHVEMEQGDLLFFMGAAQSHGAYPWTSATPRRGVIITYKSRNLGYIPDEASVVKVKTENAEAEK